MLMVGLPVFQPPLKVGLAFPASNENRTSKLNHHVLRDGAKVLNSKGKD